MAQVVSEVLGRDTVAHDWVFEPSLLDSGTAKEVPRYVVKAEKLDPAGDRILWRIGVAVGDAEHVKVEVDQVAPLKQDVIDGA